MADLTITATLVVPGGAAVKLTGPAGATLTAGQAVYQDTAGLWQLSKANGTAAQKAVVGITLNGGAINQIVTVQTGGTITIGATVAVGTIYVLSGAVAGNIAPSTDLVSGWQTITLGIATTAGALLMNLFNAAVAVP